MLSTHIPGDVQHTMLNQHTPCWWLPMYTGPGGVQGDAILREGALSCLAAPPRALWSCTRTCTQLQKPRDSVPTSPAAHMRLCSLLPTHDPACLQADVFSFGIMVYEVLQRYIMLSAVAVRGTYEELEAYCARVADGYRPPLHTKWPPSMAKLIQVRQEGQRLPRCHGVHACRLWLGCMLVQWLAVALWLHMCPYQPGKPSRWQMPLSGRLPHAGLLGSGACGSTNNG